jgi:DNA-binding LacI/PurR family transcriptional regulator
MDRPKSEKRAGEVTSRHVARMLGVSQSMVSRAFDPNGRVAPANRARIIEAATALGYRPNVIARSLSTRRSGIVAIVMGGLENPFYADVLDELALRLDEAGFRSLLFRVPPGEDVDDQLPALRQYNVDALVVASASISSRIADEWRRDARPIVLINRTVLDSPVSTVSCDNADGARKLASLLVETGHRRLAYVAGPQHTSTNREREASFFTHLMDSGLPLVGRVSTETYSFAEGQRAARESMAVKPDAIFFANDILALGGMETLRHELGLRIPQDVSVVGFDDVAMAAWPSYSLTTVRQPIAEMVRLTVSSIKDADAVAVKHVLPGELMRRGSVGIRA